VPGPSPGFSTNDESLVTYPPSFVETHLAPSLTGHSPNSSHTAHHFTHTFLYPPTSISTTAHLTHSFFYLPTSIPTSGLTSPHDSPQHLLPSSQTHTSLTGIIFAAIGGFTGLVVLALLARHAIAYSRLPRRTATLTTIERQQLARELAGYAQTAIGRQRQLPPPPYEHAPAYESLTQHEP
jgi:hypothetical protein